MRCLAGHTGHSQITQDSKFSPRTPSDAEWTTNNKKARQRQQLAVSRGAGLRRPGEQRHPAPTEEVRGQHVEAPRWGTAAQPPTPELPARQEPRPEASAAWPPPTSCRRCVLWVRGCCSSCRDCPRLSPWRSWPSQSSSFSQPESRALTRPSSHCFAVAADSLQLLLHSLLLP
ncbi:small integral membrane protein 5 isoform X1 [Macaca fascicularis]|uniref:small integral membrane protein 5 isoform X1 n=1 Tax=Macaca fascicularis TaxID=9541 RepID=UPI003D15EDE9